MLEILWVKTAIQPATVFSSSAFPLNPPTVKCTRPSHRAWWIRQCSISPVPLLLSSVRPLSLFVTGETPQRLLRDNMKEAAKSLASTVSVPKKPQQYVWQELNTVPSSPCGLDWNFSEHCGLTFISPVCSASCPLSQLMLKASSLSLWETYCHGGNFQIVTNSTIFMSLPYLQCVCIF